MAPSHLLYGNRCMAYMQIKEWEKALEDANKSIELSADYVKGHFRKGVSLTELKKKDEAITSLTQAHDLAPKDTEIVQALELAKALSK